MSGEYEKAIHNASRKAGVFCPDCTYSFNGVIDSFCDKENCPEKEFEKQFLKDHCHLCGCSINNGRAGTYCPQCD